MITLTTAEDVLAFLDTNCKVVQSHHVRIHPDAARAFLDINTRNRTVSMGRVNSLKQALRDGNWLLINNGIGIDWDGDLSDGQHRLHAVVEANLPAEFYVATGLDPRTRIVVDTGKARTLSDTLAITGYGKGLSTMAAAARLLYRYDNDAISVKTNGVPTVPHDIMLEYMRTNLDMDRLHMVDLRGNQTSRCVPGSSRSGLVAALYLMYERDAFAAGEFDDKLRYGEALTMGDPIFTLRNMLVRLPSKNGRSNAWHFCLYLKTWNLTRLKKEIHVLKFQDDEPIPEVL